MQPIEELIVLLGYEIDDANVQKFLTGLQKVKTVAGRVVNGLKAIAIAGAAAGGAIAAAGLAIGSAVLNTGEQFENLKLQLDALEGSSEAGQRAMDWIIDFAKTTPLELEQVINAYIRMRTFGLDPTDGSLAKLVDTMAASGKGAAGLEGIILAVGQAWTKQKLQGEEALQLIERGVPVWDILSEKLGKSAAEIQELSSKGKLGRKEIQLLIDELGNRYVGASEKFAQSSVGIRSNLADLFTDFKRRIADSGFFDVVKNAMEGLLDTINRLDANGKLDEIARKMSDVLVDGFQRLVGFLKQISIDDVVNALQTAIDLSSAFVRILSILGAAFQRLASVIQETGGYLGLDPNKGQAMLVVFGAILALLSPLIAKFMGIVAVAGAIALAIDDIWTYFEGGKSVTGEIIDRIKAHWQGWLDWWRSLGEAIRAAVQGWVNTQVEVWNRGTTAMMEGWNSFVARIPQPVIDAFNSIKDTVTGIWDGLIGYISASWDAVWGRISGALGSIGSFFGGSGESGGGIGNGGLNRLPQNPAPTAAPTRIGPGFGRGNVNNQTQNTANVTVNQTVNEAQAPGAVGQATANAARDAAFASAGTTAPEASY